MKPLRILLVEDHDDSALSSAVLLRLDNHIVDVAPDGQTAIDMIDCSNYDAALLDINIPGCNGWEVARYIREQENRRTVIIAITGLGSVDAIEKSSEAGMDYHLLKPVNPEMLQSILRKIGTLQVA